MNPSPANGAVRLILQIEGLCVLALALLAYEKFGVGWSRFALFFLAPDISLLGYLLDSRFGSVTYNTAHSYFFPLLLLAIAIYFNFPNVLAAGIIWAAHIGLDRMLGYGLKYSTGFRFTHLGNIGHQNDNA